MSTPETIKIDEIEYVRKDAITQPKTNTDGLKYAIVRGDHSGVFAGFIAEDSGQCVRIFNARRLWYWSGAASLSQLAMEGVKKPSQCKFPAAVPEISVRDCIEVIPATSACFDSIKGVEEWKI